ncbi:MAG: Lsr2 family protein [Nocardioidaceae bacterium]
MAQKVTVVLVDDVDGGKADETVRFGLDGVGYEIDLGTKNAKKLREALAPYVGVARKTGRAGGAGRRVTSRRTRSAGEAPAAEVRAWAQANGYELADRGRVPAEVREAYAAAH